MDSRVSAREVVASSWGRAGISLAECAGRYGSGVRGAPGICPGTRDSVEKVGDSDPHRGEIDATPKPDTRVSTWDHGC